MKSPLQPLLGAWRSVPLPKPGETWAVAASGRAFAIAGLAEAVGGPFLVLTPGEVESEELADDLGLFLPDVELAPAWETLPFEHVSPNTLTMGRRARARHRLGSSDSVVVVASVRSAVQRVSNSSVSPVTFRTDQDFDFESVAPRLAGLGYTRTDRVEARGEFAVRGGLVDVFPADGFAPFRVDFWGDTVAEIRQFSIASQRSQDQVEAIEVYPAREFRPDEATRRRALDLVTDQPWAASTWERIAQGQLFSGIESWMPWLSGSVNLLDELPQSVSIVAVDPVRAADRSRDLIEEEAELAATLAPTWGESAPEAGEHPSLFLDLEVSLAKHAAYQLPPVPTGPADLTMPVSGLDATPGDPEAVSRAIGGLLTRSITTVIAMDGEPAATGACCTVRDREATETRNLHAITLLQVGGDGADCGVESVRGLLLGKTCLCGDVVDDVCLASH